MTTTKNSMTVGELAGKIRGEGNPGFLKHSLKALVEQNMAVYVWLDATHLKVREGGRVTSNAIVRAYALNDDWQAERRYLSLEASARVTEQQRQGKDQPKTPKSRKG